ncbi:hypothetical protein FQW77_08490 [Campylobacter jejuni]|nr:hypothetical protein [Campylobacter jejuni]
MEIKSQYEALNASELGKKVLKAQDKISQIEMTKVKNEIGIEIIPAWNAFKLKEKYPFAEIVDEEFNKMLKDVIPEKAMLSSRFTSWINRERNELLVDSKLNADHYFKKQTNFTTGEINTFSPPEVAQMKIDYLEKNIDKIKKAFQTFINTNKEKAFADESECKAWKEYYAKQVEKVNNFLNNEDFSYYNKKDKDGNIKKEGTREDAEQHQRNLNELISQVDENINEATLRQQNTFQPLAENEFNDLPEPKNTNSPMRK